MIRKYGFTLIEVLVVSGLITLLTTMAIPNLLKTRVSANDVKAQATLKTIATALETYLAINNEYPVSTDTLSAGTPPYLNRNYFSGTYSGFTYEAEELNSYRYTICATPVRPGQSGTEAYRIATGGVFLEN